MGWRRFGGSGRLPEEQMARHTRADYVDLCLDLLERLESLIDSIAQETIMWELVKIARQYWKGTTGLGAIDLKA